jgi:predicted NAD/FAD-dependent oxidoreductase
VLSSPRIAIIGAGLAGIAAARTLRAADMNPILFEKSRGLGGRCSTKRWHDCRIDHGAQYFTLRDPDFRQIVTASCGTHLRRIEAPITSPSGTIIPGDDRYYHSEGNSRLARDLAQNLELRLDTPITSLTPSGTTTWLLNGEPYDHVISTAPLPQTFALLGLPLPHPTDPFIPCLALLLRYHGDQPGLTAKRYAIADPDSATLAWSACENHKLGRIPTGTTALIAHASEAFSRTHLESPPELWSSQLRSEVETLWQIDPTTSIAQHPHRWRYARVASAIPLPSLPPGIHHASDALIASRVESAYLSGTQTATHLLDSLR